MGGIESSSKGSVSLKRKDESRKAEVKSFTKTKYTIMIEGQNDSEAGAVDIGGKGLLGSRRKRKKLTW